MALRIRAERFGSVGHNVIGRRPAGADRHVLVAAHYDTAAGVPGAVDNASGTAVLLELCEQFAATAPGRIGVHFVAYGAEEYGRRGDGCLGAVEYVRRHASDVQRASAVVELDCVGTAAVPPSATMTGFPPELQKGLLGVLAGFSERGVHLRPETDTPGTPFNLTGLPTVWFVNDYRKVPIHTCRDTIDLLSPHEMARATEAAGAVVEYLTASAHDWQTVPIGLPL